MISFGCSAVVKPQSASKSRNTAFKSRRPSTVARMRVGVTAIMPNSSRCKSVSALKSYPFIRENLWRSNPSVRRSAIIAYSSACSRNESTLRWL